MTFVVKDDKENAPVAFAVNPALERVQFDQKTRLRPRRIPSGLVPGVYSTPDNSTKTPSGKHRNIRCEMVSLPLDRMIAVPVGVQSKAASETVEAEDSDTERDEVQEGSVVWRPKKKRPSIDTAEKTGQDEAQKPNECEDLRNLVQEGGSKIDRNLRSIEDAEKPLLPKPEPVQGSRIVSALRAILSAIYNFVLALFAQMRKLCCWKPTGMEIKA